MLCSICRQVEIVLDVGEVVICANSHVHCGKCLKQVKEKCQICAGSLYKYSWSGIHGNDTRNWSPEMIIEWSRKNALYSSMSEDSLEKNMDASAEDCEAASVNLLYSRSTACEAQCLQSSDSIHLSDSKMNQSPLWNNKQNQFLDADPKCSRSVQKPFETVNHQELEKKDTRQKLLEQTQQELRKKIMDGILKSYRTDKRPRPSPDEHTYIKQLRTIGVSTESTPKLLPDDSLKASPLESSNAAMPHEDNIVKQSLYNTAPPEYLLMNVGTTSVKPPLLQDGAQKKSKTSNIDLRLQQIMGILLESEKPPSKDDQHFYTRLREKFSRMPLIKLEEIISSIYNEGDDEKNTEVKNAPIESDVIPEKHPLGATAIANCRRAYYHPPDETKPNTTPDPQFQLISLRNVNISEDLLQTKIIDGTLNIPRKPIICPISTCQRMCFVSDFTKHIADYHAKEPMCIFPQQYKNFLLDPKLIHFGTNRCQFLLLVKNKIMNLGHEKFKDFIPILVMTTKLSLLEICSNQDRPQSEEVRKGTQNFVMIWLTGIMPPQLPIFFSLTVWARSGFMPACHLVHSGRVYSVCESQSPEMVRKSGQMLLLSNNQIDFLTNGGRHMLELQITVH